MKIQIKAVRPGEKASENAPFLQAHGAIGSGHDELKNRVSFRVVNLIKVNSINYYNELLTVRTQAELVQLEFESLNKGRD